MCLEKTLLVCFLRQNKGTDIFKVSQCKFLSVESAQIYILVWD